MTAFFRWLGEHPNLSMCVGMSFVMLMGTGVAHLVVDLVTQHPIESKTRFLIWFVTVMSGALVFGSAHGVLLNRYGKKP